MIIKLSYKRGKILLILSVISCLLVMVISSLESNFFNDSAEFKVKGTEIIAPNGQEFIAHGININGYGYGWWGDTPGAVNDIVERWNFNAIRLNVRDIEPKEIIEQNGTINQVIDLYTDRGLVVVLEAHEQTGDYFTGEKLDQLEAWWRKKAQEYKDNPYVWFNVSNEPGGANSSQPENVLKWLNQNQTVINAIRGESANNIIVVDAHYWGQDVGEWNSNPVAQNKSSILAHARKLKDPQNNLVFSIHLYDQWQYGEAKMEDYFNRVHAAGTPIIIGEYGAKNDGSYQNTVASALKIANKKDIGVFAWAWAGQDEFDLTTSGNGGGQYSQYDPDGNVTNLSWFGEQVWANKYKQPESESDKYTNNFLNWLDKTANSDNWKQTWSESLAKHESLSKVYQQIEEYES